MTPAALHIPRVDLSAQLQALQAELDRAIARVLASGNYILGPEVEAFEAEFAAYCGTAQCVATGSGTDALRLALTACGVGPRDEVITASHTAVPTAAAVRLTGAAPVLVDVDPDTYTMSPARAAGALTPRTRALLPVHLYGQCADMDPLRRLAGERDLVLIEDACQAHGATYRGVRAGAIGRLGCFSFYPTKNLGAYGDGGAVCTDDDELAAQLRLSRNHGLTRNYSHRTVAGNSRLDELQAAILRAKLVYLDEWNERRRTLAALYAECLSGLPVTLPIAADWGEHAYHLYVIRARQRDELLVHLRENGVDAGIHYPVPVHRQPAFSDSRSDADLPVTDALADEVLSLPMYPELTEDQVSHVADLVRAFFG